MTDSPIDRRVNQWHAHHAETDVLFMGSWSSGWPERTLPATVQLVPFPFSHPLRQRGHHGLQIGQQRHRDHIDPVHGFEVFNDLTELAAALLADSLAANSAEADMLVLNSRVGLIVRISSSRSTLTVVLPAWTKTTTGYGG